MAENLSCNENMKCMEQLTPRYDVESIEEFTSGLCDGHQPHSPAEEEDVSAENSYNEFHWSSEAACLQDISFSYSNSSANMEVDHEDEYGEEDESVGGFEDVQNSDDDGENIGQAETASTYNDSDDGYSDEFYTWNCILEEKYHPRNCLGYQSQVRAENRTKLVAWLSKVIRSQNLFPETLFLTVNIMDRFLCGIPIALECFHLLGLSALFIAAKQLETYHPTVTELLNWSAGVYSRQHFLQMERIILKQLEFCLVITTALFFVDYYIYFQSSANRVHDDYNASVFTERSIQKMVKNLVELCIQDYKLCQYPPSCMALASMAVVEEYASGQPVDLSDERYSRWDYPPSLLKECTTEIWLYLPEVIAGSISDLTKESFFEDLPFDVT